MRIMTTRGYVLLEVSSASQKAIRRGDARLAGYWAVELFESGFTAYAWRRLLTISAEDCWGIITHEVEALLRSWEIMDKRKKGSGRIFLAKAVILLCQARKCRDADHLTNLVYDTGAVDPRQIRAALEEARKHPEKIPPYAFDIHTGAGKRARKTREEFFLDEHDALRPRQPGLFDADLERLRKRR